MVAQPTLMVASPTNGYDDMTDDRKKMSFLTTKINRFINKKCLIIVQVWLFTFQFLS